MAVNDGFPDIDPFDSRSRWRSFIAFAALASVSMLSTLLSVLLGLF